MVEGKVLDREDMVTVDILIKTDGADYDGMF